MSIVKQRLDFSLDKVTLEILDLPYYYFYRTGELYNQGLYRSTKIYKVEPGHIYEISPIAYYFDFWKDGVFVSYAAAGGYTHVVIPDNVNEVAISYNLTDDLSNGVTIKDVTDSFEVKSVCCFGDSITQGTSGLPDAYPTFLKTMLGAGYDVKNYGISSNTMGDICARVGGTPLVLKSNLAFAENVTVKNYTRQESQQVFENVYMQRFSDIFHKPDNGHADFNPCMIDGHAVNINRSDTTPNIELLDSSGGVTIHAGCPVYMNTQKDASKGLVIIMAGTNGIYTDADDYLEYYKRCANFIGHGNYLMLSQFDVYPSAANYESYKSSNLAKLSDLMANESALVAEFGTKAVNMRKELVDNGLRYAIEGGKLEEGDITANDTDAISNGIVPPSLLNSTDFLHPNPAGYYAIAKIVYKAINCLFPVVYVKKN